MKTIVLQQPEEDSTLTFSGEPVYRVFMLFDPVGVSFTREHSNWTLVFENGVTLLLENFFSVVDPAAVFELEHGAVFLGVDLLDMLNREAAVASRSRESFVLPGLAGITTAIVRQPVNTEELSLSGKTVHRILFLENPEHVHFSRVGHDWVLSFPRTTGTLTLRDFFCAIVEDFTIELADGMVMLGKDFLHALEPKEFITNRVS